MPDAKHGRLTLTRIDPRPDETYHATGSIASRRFTLEVPAAAFDSFEAFAATLSAVGYEPTGHLPPTAWARAVARAMRVGGIPAAGRPAVG